ncbi:hypothetical protein Kpho02_33010 [Kitasatospora phosalacinea]|uniref:Transposase n=1 Tax=Kitasatospora phosalacinea TaxID=2065 RepID=A0A9W6Q6S3_9ACTN|nr:hypothetical protein [Kitasatospora phosalacinea]GLW71002.1 hypothetical protein Kpho02_33010 [Kitasatospora phosalacinea]
MVTRRRAQVVLPSAQGLPVAQIAKSKPAEHGLPFSTWSLAELADFLVAEGVVDDTNHEGLRVLLREEGVSFQRVKTWKTSRDRMDEFGPLNLQPTARGAAPDDEALPVRRNNKEQGRVIRRYVIRRNRHAADERLREVVSRANVAWCGTSRGAVPGRRCAFRTAGAGAGPSRL